MSIVPLEDLESVIRDVKRSIAEIKGQLKILSQSPAQKLDKKYLSADDACKILKISPRTLFKIRQEESIKFTKIRRRILFRAEDVYDFLEQRFR